MNGSDLLAEFRRRIMQENGTKSVTDRVLAKYLGITQPALSFYKEREVTPRQIANLLARARKTASETMVRHAIKPIVEFFPIDPIEARVSGKMQIFITKERDGDGHPYLVGLRQLLEETHGIYIFHDSRGRAIYAGKAQRLSLWREMNGAFNRNRGEIQNIKRVKHPTNKILYKGHEEKSRQIRRRAIPLHEVASYVSAYQVDDSLIGKLEALIIRAFANDLLNVRMEKI